MPGGATRSGAEFEEEVRTALRSGGYKVADPKASLGTNLAGNKVRSAFIAESPEGKLLLVSTYFQDGPGTTQERVPWGVLTMGELLRQNGDRFARAYFVLGGIEGFTLKKYFVSGDLQGHLTGCENVIVVDQETLRRLASKGAL